MSETRVVRPDGRHRVSLGGLVRDTQYKVTVGDGGRILLEPAVVLTETEARLAGDDGFWERVAAAAAQPRERFELDEL